MLLWYNLIILRIILQFNVGKPVLDSLNVVLCTKNWCDIDKKNKVLEKTIRMFRYWR